MLEKIEYIFPKNNKNIELFDLFFILFKDLQYKTNLGRDEIHIISSYLRPKTIFKLDNNINDLQLDIGNQKYLNLLNRKLNCKKKMSEDIIKISTKEVTTKLTGHVTRLDHTGINLPMNFYGKEEWEDLLKYFSSVSNIYNYPTGEPWPFLIPVTKEENQNEITNFEIIREPRFELVYDDYTNVVAIHIDIETDLSKLEIENLFPKNQGVYFNNCPYKAIYLNYGGDTDIRLDIRFKRSYGDFESGKWLVFEGKRIFTGQ